MEPLQQNDLDSYLDEGLQQKNAFSEVVAQENYLLHRIFAQTEDGKKLLNKWKDQMIMIPTVQPHYSQFEAGIAEGFKSFVREIINQLEAVTSEEKSNE